MFHLGPRPADMDSTIPVPAPEACNMDDSRSPLDVDSDPGHDGAEVTAAEPVDPGTPADGQRGLVDRLRTRVRKDLRNAMVDESVRPSGDFDLTRTGSSALHHDRVQNFSGLIMAVRFTTTTVAILLTSAERTRSTALVAWTCLVVGYAIFRTIKPIRYSNDLNSLLRVMLELLLHAAAVVATGGWDSPLAVTLLTAVTVAGLARGYGFSLRVAVTTSVVITIPFISQSPDGTASLLRSATWSGIVLLVAIVAGYTRRLSGEADREHAMALDRLDRLSDANALLSSLHRVTQTLPASLDLGDVLDSTVSRLRSLIAYDSVAILLFDEVDAHWQVARHQGMHVRSRLGATELPEALRRAIAEDGVVHVTEPGVDQGLSGRAGSGLYATLEARGAIIGLLAIEHGDLGEFTERDVEVIRGLTAPAALAVDNARWFARLRTVGADEERTRIARDLHDRIGQSLAYLAFELDRLVDDVEGGRPVAEPLAQLRNDVRGVIREVRDTLYDLRTDVSEEHGIAPVLEEYVARVAERSMLTIHVDADRDHRLPLLQEREMWRVAQEALANVEKHANATAVRVIWRCDGGRAYVDVTDNGVGFENGKAGRLDSYGMLGMRERASSIGAVLEIISAPGRGTRLRCSLNPTEVTAEDVVRDETTAEGARDEEEPTTSTRYTVAGR